MTTSKSRDILELYSGCQNTFHNSRHALATAEAAKGLARRYSISAFDQELLAYAALLHSAVYVPGNVDNVHRSSMLSYGMFPTATAHRISRLIEVTAHDEELYFEIEPLEAIIADADLYMLAARPLIYDAYAHDVRMEYADRDAAFLYGREAFLTAYLAKEHIYATPYARQQYESLARKNIGRELAGLKAEQ